MWHSAFSLRLNLAAFTTALVRPSSKRLKILPESEKILRNVALTEHNVCQQEIDLSILLLIVFLSTANTADPLTMCKVAYIKYLYKET